MTPNETVIEMLEEMITQIQAGGESDNLQDAMTALIIMVTLMAQGRLKNAVKVIGALELAKARLLHDYHDLLSRGV